MSFEDRYDAMSDYNAERQGEGRTEAINEIYEYFKDNIREKWSKEEILKYIGGLF